MKTRQLFTLQRLPYEYCERVGITFSICCKSNKRVSITFLVCCRSNKKVNITFSVVNVMKEPVFIISYLLM